MSAFDKEELKNYHNTNKIDYVKSKTALKDGSFFSAVDI
jgi:hypothetical protein